jgi:hypothetical protein
MIFPILTLILLVLLIIILIIYLACRSRFNRAFSSPKRPARNQQQAPEETPDAATGNVYTVQVPLPPPPPLNYYAEISVKS